MSRKLFLLIICLLASGHVLFAQGHEARLNEIDVLQYVFKVELNDLDDHIQGETTVKISYKMAPDEFYLDLRNMNKDGLGMTVSAVLENEEPVQYRHAEDKLFINPVLTKTGEMRIYKIKYHGRPENGLVIGENKYGNRTFFADHWPDRAQYWLPCVDHPSDKAMIEFIVTAPEYYDIIGSGYLVDEYKLNGKKTAHWKTRVPLPTKISVIAAADFDIVDLGFFNSVPLSAWVYPEETKYAYDAYSITVDVLDYFSTMVAPYPYSKLANVQSKTIYGGTENAGNIFYNEDMVVRKGQPVFERRQDVVVHEIAHQWFGNSVSEANWHHVWISEGFATYFTDLYIENRHGVDSFQTRMDYERRLVIWYNNNRSSVPVVDTTPTDPAKLLSPITYEKGAWFLHMLRHKTGDDLFWEIIGKYYDQFKFGNVVTEDFQEIAEKASGIDLDEFFKQWLYRAGHPVLSFDWEYNNGKILLAIEQNQSEGLFKFPVDIQFVYDDSESWTKTFYINKASHSFTIEADRKPAHILPDPEVWLLYEYKD